MAPHPAAAGPTSDDGDDDDADDEAEDDADAEAEDDADEEAEDDANEEAEDDADDEAEDDADDEAEDDADDEAEDDTGDEAPAASPQLVPLHWNAGSAASSWTDEDWNISVNAGNFSWHGINCSWEAFNWSAGENPLLLLNMTCTLWDIITVVIANGTVNVTWSAGSWDFSFMPAAPVPPIEAPVVAPASAPAAPFGTVVRTIAPTWHAAW
jgi:hypothetical protein